jgi:hypothetical protein
MRRHNGMGQEPEFDGESEEECSSMEVCDSEEDLIERMAALDGMFESYDWQAVILDEAGLLAGLSSPMDMDMDRCWDMVFLFEEID